MRLYIDARAGLTGEELLPALAHAGLDMRPLEQMLRQSGLVEEFSFVPASGRQGNGLRLIMGCRKEPPPPLPECFRALPAPPRIRDATRDALARLEAAERAVFSLPQAAAPEDEKSATQTGGPLAPDQKLRAAVLLFSLFWACETYSLASVFLSPLPWAGQSASGVGSSSAGQAGPSPLAAYFLRGRELTLFSEKPSLAVRSLGAFLLDSLVTRHGAPQAASFEPQGKISALGVGYADSTATGDTPGLRLLLLDGAPPEDREHEWIYLLESHIDHLSGEDLGRCFSALPEAGALDVLWLPALMKKSRPGGVLRALCRPEALDQVERAFFKHTHTLGVRRALVERTILPRREATIETPEGALRVKTYVLDGKEFSRPEYEELLELSRKTGKSLPELRLLAARLLAE